MRTEFFHRTTANSVFSVSSVFSVCIFCGEAAAERVASASRNSITNYLIISNGIRQGGEAAAERVASASRKAVTNYLINKASPMGFDKAAKPPQSASRQRRATPL